MIGLLALSTVDSRPCQPCPRKFYGWLGSMLVGYSQLILQYYWWQGQQDLISYSIGGHRGITMDY